MDEEGSTWVGQGRPPTHPNEVSVKSPTGDLTQHEISFLDSDVDGWYKFADDASRVSLWVQGLGCVKAM